VERQNLTIRMQMRRLTRLTNAFSKKWENLWSAYCLHFAWYNFVCIHRTLWVTPAMEARITSRAWGLAHLLGVWRHEETDQPTFWGTTPSSATRALLQ
jgi:hypothetical protein